MLKKDIKDGSTPPPPACNEGSRSSVENCYATITEAERNEKIKKTIESAINDFKSDINKRVSGLESKINGLQEEINKLKQLSHRSSSLGYSYTQNPQNNQPKEIQADSQGLKTESTECKECKKLKEENKNFQKNLDELKNENDRLKSKNDDLEQQIESLKTNIDEKEKELTSSIRQVETLKQEKSQLNQELENKRAELIKLEQNERSLEYNLKSLGNEKSHLNQKIENLEKEKGALRLEKEALEKSYAPVKDLSQLYDLFLKVKNCFNFGFIKETYNTLDLIGYILADTQYYLKTIYETTQQQLKENRQKGEELAEFFNALFSCVKHKDFTRLEVAVGSNYNNDCTTLRSEQKRSGVIERVVLQGYKYKNEICYSVVETRD
ncbi:hypothetical protein [Helicobacter cetorum]|uniref:hypothetical protein n=1 Tax=Helicobacter cetorum TaxID=138563 RepID=UPI000CF15D8A|nr:hypothetical protein [Helicobacter cetorum]